VSEVDAAIVFVVALLTALATALGALPLLVTRETGGRTLGLSNAAASGVMAAASVSLVLEGLERSGLRTLLGVVAGAAFVLVVSQRLHAPHHSHDFGSLRGEDAIKALLIVGVMTVHSFAEGIGIGAAFGGGETLGFLIAIAIAVHNIPEGLAISLVLVPRGVSVRSAAGWSIFSSLPQPLVAVPAFVFVDAFEGILPAALGFAAGAMGWMVARELIPDALGHASVRAVAATAGAAFACMLAFQIALL
jgi:zinc transporter ZupT